MTVPVTNRINFPVGSDTTALPIAILYKFKKNIKLTEATYKGNAAPASQRDTRWQAERQHCRRILLCIQ